MPQVAAGDVTGLYYIVVAGLPWQCTWQRLKDFARNGSDGVLIDIDHALVYPDSTDGWVRVKGKGNFQRALAHLDGGVLDHRCIVADGRNATQTTTLRDTVQWTPSLARRHRGSSAKTSRDCHPSPVTSQDYFQIVSLSNSSYAASEASLVDPYYTPQQTYSLPSPLPYNTNYENTGPFYDYTCSYSTNPPISYAYSVTSAPGIIYTPNMESCTPVYFPPTLVTYTVPGYAEDPPSSSNINHYPSPASAVVKTEARKIIITQLPHSVSKSDLRDLLFSTIAKLSRGYSYEAVEDVEVVIHADGTPRGHAFAVFESYSLAKYVVKTLDGLKFKGRTLQARFAKEGVESSTRNYSPREEERWNSSLKDQTQTVIHEISGSTNKRSTRSPKVKETLTGDTSGSTSRHERKSFERKSTRDSSGEKKEKHRPSSTDPVLNTQSFSSVSPPLVVDGSSSRKYSK